MMIKSLTATLPLVVWPALGDAGDATRQGSASLTQAPLVMRLGKDEFRIAFGIRAEGCAPNGCRGFIHYRVVWRTDDGTMVSENKRVSYSVLPHYTRTITVDRAYFDTAEDAHATAVIKVTVNNITCSDSDRPG